jgi:hypothetical protein
MKSITNVFCALLAVTLSHISNAQPFSDDILNNPSKHAWDLFLRLNHPAKPTSVGRGLPDETKQIGAPGTTTVWETWRLSSKEVFLQPPNAPPQDFNTPPDPSLPPNGKVPEINTSMFLTLLKNNGGKIPKDRLHIFFDPEGGLFNRDKPSGGFGESRMNKATYDFVLKNGLYNRAGIIAYAQQFFAGQKPAPSFPIDSMEAKAAWMKFTPQELASGKDQKFYVADYKGDKYGLTSLHIITKEIPNWFWCTFHHKDVPAGFETPDTYGQPQELKGTVWENYKLGGTQDNFVTSTGQPTLLSDGYIEYGFTTSSCISCHAGAAVDVSGDPTILGSRIDAIGSPDPKNYFKNGKPVLMQLDFLFSVAFRAQ